MVTISSVLHSVQTIDDHRSSCYTTVSNRKLELLATIIWCFRSLLAGATICVRSTHACACACGACHAWAVRVELTQASVSLASNKYVRMGLATRCFPVIATVPCTCWVILFSRALPVCLVRRACAVEFIQASLKSLIPCAVTAAPLLSRRVGSATYLHNTIVHGF